MPTHVGTKLNIERLTPWEGRIKGLAWGYVGVGLESNSFLKLSMDLNR